jgi:hypothetical protein
MSEKSENPFGQKWESYLRRVMPASAGRAQFIETRRAFYAGGAALFETLMSILDDGAEPTDNHLKAVDNLKAELDAFIADLRNGQG